MSAIDLPPGIGLEGTPLGTFQAPRGARRLATASLVLVLMLLALTWYLVSRHPWQYGASSQCAEPVTGSSFTPSAGAKKRLTKSA